MDGTILNATVTEKNGLSLAVELEVEDYTDEAQTIEGRELVRTLNYMTAYPYLD